MASPTRVVESPDKPSGATSRAMLPLSTPTPNATHEVEGLGHRRSFRPNAPAMPRVESQPHLFTTLSLNRTDEAEGSENADDSLNGNGKREQSAEAPHPQGTVTKRPRIAGSGLKDATVTQNRTPVLQAGRYPATTLWESRHAEQRQVPVAKEQRDVHEAPSSNGPPSEIDELEDIPDTQTTLVESEQYLQNPYSEDDPGKAAGYGKLGANVSQAAVQYGSSSDLVEFYSSAVPNDTRLSEAAHGPVQQPYAALSPPQSIVPSTALAGPKASTGDFSTPFISRQEQIPGPFFNNPYIPTPPAQSSSAPQTHLQSKKNSPLQRRSSEIPPSAPPGSPARRRQTAPYSSGTSHGSRPTSSLPYGHSSQPSQPLNAPTSTRDTGLPPGVQASYSSHLPLLRQRSESGMPILYQAYRTFWLPRNSNYFVLTDPTHPARTQVLNAPATGDPATAEVQMANPSFFYWDPLPLLPGPLQCLSPGCSYRLEHDGFAKVLKKVASQSGDPNAHWSGFWLVAARYKCEHCKSRAAENGRKYNSVIAWDPRLLAKLSPTLRSEFPAVEVEKRFYALESVVPPEYRIDSQTFLVSVTKSSRSGGHPSAGPSSLSHPSPTLMAHSATQSSPTPSHSRRSSSLSGRAVDVDPNSRLGALRPLSVSTGAPPLQPSSQSSHSSSSQANYFVRAGHESRPTVYRPPHPTNLTPAAPQEPAHYELNPHEHHKDRKKDPAGTPRTCMKCMRTCEECAGYVGSQHCKFPCAGCGRIDCPKRHTLRSGNQCLQDRATHGSTSEMVGYEGEPGTSSQGMDDFYLDTSYFEEGGDEELVDGVPLTRG
ncbi:hypothetical protein FRC01_009280 [Tulasnella sp. 417]|nr:hypothetical protein FRC01_009280 [Tulasnella sp. 417]